MRKTTIILAAAVIAIVGGCSRRDGTAANKPNGRPQNETAPSIATTSEAQKKQSTNDGGGGYEGQCRAYGKAIRFQGPLHPTHC